MPAGIRAPFLFRNATMDARSRNRGVARIRNCGVCTSADCLPPVKRQRSRSRSTSSASEANAQRKTNSRRHRRRRRPLPGGRCRPLPGGRCHCSVAATPNTEPRHDAEFFLSRSRLEGLCSYRDQAQPECGFPFEVKLQSECPVPWAKRGVHALDTNLQNPFCERLGKYHR